MNFESLDSTTGTYSSSVKGQDDSALLRRYVTKLEKLAEVGRNHKFGCSYCRQEFIGSYLELNHMR